VILLILLVCAISRLRLARSNKLQIEKEVDKQKDQKRATNQYARNMENTNEKASEENKHEEREEDSEHLRRPVEPNTSYENIDLSVEYINFKKDPGSRKRSKSESKETQKAVTNLTANEVYGMNDQTATGDQYYMTVSDL
jgi:hypothetical protein